MRSKNNSKVHDVFFERWSPRALSSEPIPQEDIDTLFEAARWSPSCYNEQPWRFVYASKAEDLARFRSALGEANQVWANSAPLLVFVFSKKTFSRNESANRWAEFDTGSAWMAISLQASMLGLHTHGIGGYDTEQAFKLTGIDPNDYNAICAIAIGKQGDSNQLPENLQRNEAPSDRKPVSEFVFEGVVG